MRRERLPDPRVRAVHEPSSYTPRDVLALWWLGDPAQPRRVGEISLTADKRRVALRYAPDWLTAGFALSEDLPLTNGLFVPARQDEAAGAVDDARPDRWGERVIRRFEPSPRLSLLEYLLFAGDERCGALGVSLRTDAYEPWRATPLPRLENLEEMGQVVRRVLANEPVPELQQRLLRPGASLGGARPKSLLQIDHEPWLVKFSEGEDLDMELIEHATMTLAAACGVDAARTRALPVGGRHAVAVRRFDRAGGARVHVVSAHVVLRAAGDEFGYPQLAQQLRRLAPAHAIAAQQHELFRRMLFNILVDNTDDHEKNHALLRQADGTWRLAPAFDVLPAAQGLGVQSLRVGQAGHDASLDNALSQAAAFGLRLPTARALAQEVARGVDRWRAHFRAEGVRERDIETLAQYIDGPALGPQRGRALAGGA